MNDTVTLLQVSMLVIGPLNQCRALMIQEATARKSRPPTATGV